MTADDELDALFALPPEEFTAARNALAKTRPEAKSLRRPTHAASVVNRIARERRGELEGTKGALCRQGEWGEAFGCVCEQTVEL